MTARGVRFDTVPAEARAFHGQPAGIATRIVANVVDLALAGLLVAGVYFGVAGVLFLRQGAEFRFPVVSYPQAYAAGVLTLIAYFTICWSAGGRTYGDQLLGLRVRTVDDLDLSIARALVRAVLCVAFPLLLLWVAVDARFRSVQDLVMRTHVVYDWGGRRTDVRSNDPVGVGVDVAPPVADEADDGDAEPLPGLDREG
jgi:uncharacterized RDD family membrane protein YckC